MKKILFSLLGLLLIVTISAFALNLKTEKSVKPLATKNFVYNAYPDDSPGMVNDPSNYSLTASLGTTPLNCPVGASHRCGVIAIDDGTGHPDLNQSYTIKTRN